MFKKILIANRGEIAVRVARTARRMGIATVAVYSDADQGAPHVRACDEAVPIGPAAATESYLRMDKIIAAMKATGAEAVHPGYGFLSENAAFADALEAEGLVFIGPTSDTIKAMGSKSAAKDLMEAAGVPTTPGYQGADQSQAVFLQEAERIGYPVLLKATAGGGGKGMRLVECAEDLPDALASAQREAKSAFGDDRFLIEKYIARARHVEVQIFGDGQGNVVHMFERDCSVQRRHQKIIEEAPAPNLPQEVREKLLKAGVDAGKAVHYRGAGTVEFLYDGHDGVYFMEMNTRLQVEHPVSEMITGRDFVEWQLRIAAGDGLPLAQRDIQETGWAFESRLYAEDPSKDFAPSTGRISHFRLPSAPTRIDSGVKEGQEITPFYDPMIAKIITHGASRAEALGAMRAALRATRIAGLETNSSFLYALCNNATFMDGNVSTRFIDDHGATLFDKLTVGPAIWAAAALWQRNQGPSAKDDPWEDLPGFRLNGPDEEVFWIEVDGTASLLRLHHQGGDKFAAVLEPDASAQARRAGQDIQPTRHFEFAGQLTGDDALRLQLEGQDIAAFAAPESGALRLWIDAQHVDVSFPDPLLGTSGQGAGEGSLTAPMPGVVTALSAKIGDTIKAGSALMIMEAMKMEHTIKAPVDGVVKAFRFQPGDQVSDGDLLVELDEV